MTIRTLKTDNTIISTMKNRFYEKVLLPNENGCMEWIGCLNKHGYGLIRNQNTSSGYMLAHRFSYKLHYGEIPKEMCICHSCDNPKCVAIDHLWLGTHKDNMTDCKNKKRTYFRGGEKNSNSILTNKETKIIYLAKNFGYKRKTLSQIYKVSLSVIDAIWYGKRKII